MPIGTAQRLTIFATAARGTEGLLAEELAEIGVGRIRQDRGGVRFSAGWVDALRVCLWTRIAMRVLYPLGRFEAGSAEELYDAARQVGWEEHLTTASTFAVEATLRGSEHRHSGYVALKIKDAIADRLRDKLGARPDVDPRTPVVRVVAHVAGRALSLSLDLCGAPLHQRGYRIRQTAAPLKETLAAAILRAVRCGARRDIICPPKTGIRTAACSARPTCTGRATAGDTRASTQRDASNRDRTDARGRARTGPPVPPR